MYDYNLLQSQCVGIEGIRTAETRDLFYTGITEIDSVINTISKHSITHAYCVSKYFDDFIKSTKRMYDVLYDHGYCIMVVGNTKVQNKKIHVNTLAKKILENIGFEIKMELIDEIKQYGFMTKRNKTSSVIESESILVLSK